MAKYTTTCNFEEWLDSEFNTANLDEIAGLIIAINSKSDYSPFKCGPNPYKPDVLILWREESQLKLVLGSNDAKQNFLLRLESFREHLMLNINQDEEDQERILGQLGYWWDL